MRVDQGLLRKLRSYFLPLPGNLCARVYRATDQAIGNAAWTAISFSDERWDTGTTPPTRQDGTGYPNGFYDFAAQPTRLTAVKSGFYVISGSITWEKSAIGGTRIVRIYLNDTTSIAQHTTSPVASYQIHQTISTIYWLAAGDFVTLEVWQDTEGGLDIISSTGAQTGNFSPEFSMVRVP